MIAELQQNSFKPVQLGTVEQLARDTRQVVYKSDTDKSRDKYNLLLQQLQEINNTIIETINPEQITDENLKPLVKKYIDCMDDTTKFIRKYTIVSDIPTIKKIESGLQEIKLITVGRILSTLDSADSADPAYSLTDTFTGLINKLSVIITEIESMSSLSYEIKKKISGLVDDPEPLIYNPFKQKYENKREYYTLNIDLNLLKAKIMKHYCENLITLISNKHAPRFNESSLANISWLQQDKYSEPIILDYLMHMDTDKIWKALDARSTSIITDKDKETAKDIEKLPPRVIDILRERSFYKTPHNPRTGKSSGDGLGSDRVGERATFGGKRTKSKYQKSRLRKSRKCTNKKSRKSRRR